MTVPVDVYILDTLMRGLVGHDRHPSAFLVYLFLWRMTHGKGRPRVQIALTDIAENIGLSKRSVQDALSRLQKRKLISIERASITAIPRYTVLRPWMRSGPAD
ncbi:MAG: helix-turn-helix domain-containing protein [Gemmataceae bacterium]